MRTNSIISAASVAALLTAAGPAWAQANRTFVSGHGEDTNPCSLAAPCRSFAQALTQTVAGGEITVLDSAGYGTLTIAKSVTITNPGGVEAGVTATGAQDAIQINAGTSSINVTLRGLTLQGVSGNTGNGVDWVSGGGNLNIIDCVTKDFGVVGILVTPAANSPALDVTISNTAILNNGAGGIAITPQASAGLVNYSISHTIANGSGNGLGIAVSVGAAASGTISFVHSEMNSIGLFFGAAGDLTIINSVFRHNLTDMSDEPGPGSTLYLYDANTIGVLGLPPGVITKTDGTNNIVSITGGGSVTKVAPQ